MSKINVFIQGEGIKDVVRLQIEPRSTALDVKNACAAQLGVRLHDESALFAEDQDHPLDDVTEMASIASKRGVHVHLNRCHRIKVSVVYSGRTVERVFGPGVTVGTVKLQAAKELGITKDDAAELILQIAGTQDQPDADVHIGTLSRCPECAIAFDLVPNPRIQGAC